jgi:hypothetical protein
MFTAKGGCCFKRSHANISDYEKDGKSIKMEGETRMKEAAEPAYARYVNYTSSGHLLSNKGSSSQGCQAVLNFYLTCLFFKRRIIENGVSV